MKFLLDTHTLIWFSEDDEKLPLKIRNLFNDNTNEFYISIATLWEMAIKINKGTLLINRSFDEIIELIFLSGFNLLPISHYHTKELLKLPLIHKDPFDRMLITQTKFENMILLSNELLFDFYEIIRMW